MKVAKKRFHISLSKPEENILINLSKRDEVPVATKAVELLVEALDMHEDEVLLNRLNERRNDKQKFIDLEDCLDDFK